MARPKMKIYSGNIEEIKTKRVLVRANSREEAQAKMMNRKWISSRIEEGSLLECIGTPRETNFIESSVLPA
jgi:hypothetical protein